MDRIDTPLNQRSRDTRAAVLDATWQLLEQSGGAGLTMAAVADAAGISRRGLYLHFSSRGQLFGSLVAHIDEAMGLEASLRPLIEAPDALTALDALGEHVAHYHSRLVAIIRAMDRSRHDDPDAAALWAGATATWYEGCRGLADRLAAEGRLAAGWTPTTAADLLWALMSVELLDDLVGDRGWSVDDYATRLKLLMRRTLCDVGEEQGR